MGRIKTQLIKRTATEIVRMYGQGLTKSYEENKLFILPKLKVSSGKLRNAIIGYATRLIKLKKLE